LRRREKNIKKKEIGKNKEVNKSKESKKENKTENRTEWKERRAKALQPDGGYPSGIVASDVSLPSCSNPN
jgi:hypothetical protein